MNFDYFQVKNSSLELAIASRGDTTVTTKASSSKPTQSSASVTLPPAQVKNGVKPNCRYVNVQLCGMECHEGVSGSCQATVLLENPAGQFVLKAEQLVEQVSLL